MTLSFPKDHKISSICAIYVVMRQSVQKNTKVEYGLGFRQNSVSPSVDTPGITAGGGMKMIRSIAGKVVQPGEVVSLGIPSWRLFRV